ncbi:hypothetical protein LBMAG18_13500 [Alphaproteobacteria bacterium]|nr:hypothetical protein LBMAG18_13500 [Alphaproteobacteria bacterium]
MKSVKPKKKQLFTSSSYHLSFKKRDDSQSDIATIGEFTPNKFLLTRDIAYEIANVPADLRNKADKKDQVHQQISSSTDSVYHCVKTKTSLQDLADKEIEIAHLIALESGNEKFISQSNKKTRVDVDDQKIKRWHDDLRVYFSPDLTDTKKTNILKRKTKLSQDNIHGIGHLSTFMAESQIYIDSKNNILDEPMPIKVLGFCYPDFRCSKEGGVFWRDKQQSGDYLSIYIQNQDGSRKDYYLDLEKIKKDINEVLRINILAVVEEAKKQKKPIPFILNIPNAFLAGLPAKTKHQLKIIIAEELNILKRQYYQQVDEHISEFIVVGGSAWDSDKGNNKSVVEIFKDENYEYASTHVVNADMISIASALHKKDIICPLPMMANPSDSIGCQYVDVGFSLSAFDEMLARATGGLHRAVFDGGVLKENQKEVKDVEKDPVFKTFNQVNYKKHQVEGNNIFVADTHTQLLKGDTHHDSIKNNIVQFAFKCNAFNEEKIDVADIFSSAVSEAVKGLSRLEGYEKKQDQANDLLNILIFANIHQGIGNKAKELEKYLNKENPNTDNSELIEQAKRFSAKFQKIMTKKQMLTPRLDGREVGARLHRMATLENIKNLFQNCPAMLCHDMTIKQIYEEKKSKSSQPKAVKVAGSKRLSDGIPNQVNQS